MAEPLQLTGICSVAVQVRNLDRSLAFYRDMLGLCLEHREGWIAQLHGQGGTPPTLVLLEVGDRAGHHQSAAPGLVRVAWRVDRQADLDLTEHLLKSHGVPYQRRREDGGDIVDTRDPDRTHLLLVWLDEAQLAGKRLPPRLYTFE
jgi:catechol 2,3-dioxygenase-like lactoylglutathione lyase family enzyme